MGDTVGEAVMRPVWRVSCPVNKTVNVAPRMSEPARPNDAAVGRDGMRVIGARASSALLAVIAVLAVFAAEHVVEANFPSPSAINPWFPMFSGHSLP